MQDQNKILLRIITGSILITCYTFACAQVFNDNIENALFLQHDHIVNSRTHGCTVQWSCVDESLTGKCIDYHNDQWFQFNSKHHSELYINISGQQCRDMRGVQIVALKGEPCNTATYEILTCVSLANQNDIYVELNSLDRDQDYLINIDGYLHDYCSFQIEISPQPRGLPLEQNLDIISQSSRQDHMIQIEWHLPDSLKYKISGFDLFRKTKSEFKMKYVGEIPVEANAYGEIENHYLFKDSIPANTSYEYLLAARKDNGKLLMINTYQFYYAHQPTNPRFIRYIQIPLEDVKNKESITVIIYDFVSGKILDHLVFTYKRKDPAHFTYRTYKAIQDEISKLNVKVINNNTKITRTYTYDLWKD